MKKLLKLFTIALLTLTIFTCLPAKVYAVSAGGETSVTFTISNANSANGEVTVSGNGEFQSLSVGASGGNGSFSPSSKGSRFFVDSNCDDNKGSINVTVKVKVNSNASVGDQIVVECKYEYSQNSTSISDSQTKTITIESSSSPSNPEPAPETSDDSESESTVTTPTKREVIKIDYTELEDAIDNAKNGVIVDDLIVLIQEFLDDYNRAITLLKSNNQSKVDEGAELLASITKELEDYLEELRTPKEKEVEKIVEVEVYPTDKYCNIPIHKIWPLLFLVSLIVNAILAILLIKKRNAKEKDDTPVVHYNISDDSKRKQ